MADEPAGSTGSEGASQSVESNAASTTESNAPSVTGIDAATAAKLQGNTNGQAANVIEGKFGEAGQGEKPPAKAKEPEPAKEPPKWDEDSTKWISSKGLDLAAFDPSNEAHQKLVKSARSAESEMTKAQQAAKDRETLELSKVAKEPPKDAPKVLTPIEKHRETYRNAFQAVCNLQGYANEQEFREQNPRAWQALKDEENETWKEAFVEQSKFEKQQEQEAKAKEQAQLRFAEDMKTLNRLTEDNLSKVRQSNPKFDEAWKASGIDKVLEFLDKTHSLPKEFFLHDPVVAKWFADAVGAMEYQRGEDGRKASWQKDYEKGLMKAKSAELPSPGKSGDRAIDMQQTAQQTSGWKGTLEKAKV